MKIIYGSLDPPLADSPVNTVGLVQIALLLVYNAALQRCCSTIALSPRSHGRPRLSYSNIVKSKALYTSVKGFALYKHLSPLSYYLLIEVGLMMVPDLSLSTFTNEKFRPKRYMPQLSGLFFLCFAGISEIVRLVPFDSNHCITPR